MKPLVCKICNGSLVMDSSSKYAVCESCGMKYVKEDLISTIDQPIQVEMVNGDISKKKLISNINTFINMRDNENAKKCVDELLLNYPDDWNAWYTAAKYYYSVLPNVSSSEFVLSSPYYQEILNCKKNAIKINKDSYEKFRELHSTWKEGLEKKQEEVESRFEDKLENSTCLFSALGLDDRHLYGEQDFKKKSYYKNVFREEANQLMQSINENNLYPRINLLFDFIDVKEKVLGRSISINNDGSFTLYYTDNNCIDYKYTEIDRVAYLSKHEIVLTLKDGNPYHANKNFCFSFKDEVDKEEIINYLKDNYSQVEKNNISKSNKKCNVCLTDLNEYGYCVNCKKVCLNDANYVSSQFMDEINSMTIIERKAIVGLLSRNFVLKDGQLLYVGSFNCKDVYLTSFGIDSLSRMINYTAELVVSKNNKTKSFGRTNDLDIDSLLDFIYVMEGRRANDCCPICGAKLKKTIFKTECDNPKCLTKSCI